MKKTILVFYGGKSCEHDISVITALQVMTNCDKEKYEVVPVYIGRDGIFRTSGKAFEIDAYKQTAEAKKSWHEVTLLPRGNKLYALKGGKRLGKPVTADAALVCCHGMNGEDGTLQGLLELCDIPYSSASVAGSAVGMDKIFMKRIFASLGFSALPFVPAERSEFLTDKGSLLNKIESAISYPLIVKPSNLGSSIGISKCADREGLCFALSVALQFDSRAVVEKAVENLREVNISALSVSGKVLTSECEEPVLWQNFLSFEDKYLVGDKSAAKGGMANLYRKMPAEITAEQKSEIEETAKKLYGELQCTGAARVDYIIDKDDDKVYINEINTVPGSFAFYLWEKSFSLRELIDKILENALAANKAKNMSTYAYESPVLEHYKSSGKIGK